MSIHRVKYSGKNSVRRAEEITSSKGIQRKYLVAEGIVRV